jgi:hypothetical protein
MASAIITSIRRPAREPGVTHMHVWAEGRSVVICQQHATPGRLARFANRCVPPQTCDDPTCNAGFCWVAEVHASAGSPQTPCGTSS